MLGTVHEYELTIIERHLDGFGHVNNSKYLEIFEEARWDLITRNGYGFGEVMSRRTGPTILEAHLVFKRELRNRQQVVVKSWLESHAEKVGTFMQHLVGEGGAVHCEARFVMGLFDLSARRLIPPTPEWWRAMGITPPPAGE
jgi:YbgC/YbaW family acyl-CoA thioester hydrolase